MYASQNESKKVVGGGLHAENQAAFRVIGKGKLHLPEAKL